MNLQEILKAVNDNTLAVAKALQSGNNEEAVDLLTKHAEVINSRIEKSSDPEKTEEKEKEVPDNIPKWPIPDSDPIGDKSSPSESETKTVEKSEKIALTKTQHDFLTKAMELWNEWLGVLMKFVEMYISAGDVPDFVNQFDEIKDRLSKLETHSQQLPESEEIKKSTLEWILHVQ